MAQLMPLPLTLYCFSKIQIGFTFLVPAHALVPEKWPLNARARVSVLCKHGDQQMRCNMKTNNAEFKISSMSIWKSAITAGDSYQF